MAIKSSRTRFGITTPCYSRVDTVTGGKRGIRVYLSAFAYQDGEDADYTNTEPFEICDFRFPFEMDPVVKSSPNLLAQAYTLLKSLPEFADAVDC